MPRSRPFRQIDVFTTTPCLGNPVAVVLDGDDLSTEEMQRFARWMNLSETTFVLPPSSPQADYRVRIFTPTLELPFAGHPTLGTCHAWLETGGTPRDPNAILQECEAGVVIVRPAEAGFEFAAPALRREGPVDEATASEVLRALRLDRSHLVDLAWADNGPGWIAVLLESAEDVLKLVPAYTELAIGVAGAYPTGSPEAFEVRAFFPKDGALAEDPVTGSFNASLAQWLTVSGRAHPPYVARQGTALGRAGRVHITQDANAVIWVGGGTVTCVEGTVDL
jgi:PhzF family phenazine biosynthesis protein